MLNSRGAVRAPQASEEPREKTMQTPLQITVRDIKQSEALEARIRDKVARLEQFHPNMTSCRVTVESAHRHSAQGRHFQVKVDVRVPGKEIVASRDHDEDVYVALREAFDAAKRQLDDEAEAQTRARRAPAG
jgi:ribosomal subunit interface protein